MAYFAADVAVGRIDTLRTVAFESSVTYLAEKGEMVAVHPFVVAADLVFLVAAILEDLAVIAVDVEARQRVETAVDFQE